MAAQHDSVFRFPSWHSVKLEIKTTLRHEYSLDDADVIHVTKRNTNFYCGDFLAIIPSMTASSQFLRRRIQTNDVNRVADVDAPTSEQAKLNNIAWEKVRGIKIREATWNKNGEICIYLDRQEMFRATLEKALHQGFGRGEGEAKNTVLVNMADAPELSSEGGEITLCQMRTLLLSQHISKLMQANGYGTALIPYGFSEKNTVQLQECGIRVNKENHGETFLKEYPLIQQELMRKITCSPYLYSVDVTIGESPSTTRQMASQPCTQLLPEQGCESGTSNRTAHHNNTKLLDLRGFMDENKSAMLSKGYDKNLQLVDVGSRTDMYEQLCALEQQARLVQSQDPQLTIHVLPRQHSFRQQQVDISWRIVSQTTCANNQVYLVHAGVSSSPKGATLFPELFSQRRKQMEQAASLKYGDVALEPQWQNKITALTMAGIQFQVLMTSCRHQVKFQGCDNVSEMHHLPGVFVMYNYARLVSLLARFHAAVKHGTYPDLPAVKDIDFGVLTDEDEWALLFNYVLSFPSVVMETISTISPNQLKADIHSHRICQFLYDLSRDLSSYYSRVRVLAEPQPRLLSTMYARVHLLQTLAQVMRDGLALLNIEPISQL